MTIGGAARRLLFAFLLAVGGAGAWAGGITVTLPGGQRIQPATDAEVQRLVRYLIANGDTRTAAALIRNWQPNHPDHAIRIAYVDGLIAAAGGDDALAVTLWRGILAQRPGLDLVRVQLTGALARMGRDTSARFQAERLIAAGVDDRLDGAVSNLVRTLDGRRPLSFGLSFTLKPSSNINGGTDNSTIRFGPLTGRIPESSRRKSGVGASLSGRASWRDVFDRDSAIIASLDATATHYGAIDRLETSADLTFGIEATGDRATLLPALIAGGRDVNGSARYRYSGLSLETSARLGERWRLHTAPQLRFERFPAVPGESGVWFDLPVQLDHFHGAGSFTRLIAGGSVARRDEDRFSYREARLGLGHYREFPGGITVYGEILAAERLYDGLYPGLTEARHDRRLRARATLTKRDFTIAGFAPRVTLLVKRTRSNSAFDDTTRREVGFRFVRDF